MSFERLSAAALLDRISATARSLRFRLMLWNIAAGVLTGLGILIAVREGVRYTLIFDGMLARGERKVINRRGPVTIGYNVGANLQVELKGKLYRMTGGDGIGKSTIP